MPHLRRFLPPPFRAPLRAFDHQDCRASGGLATRSRGQPERSSSAWWLLPARNNLFALSFTCLIGRRFHFLSAALADESRPPDDHEIRDDLGIMEKDVGFWEVSVGSGELDS